MVRLGDVCEIVLGSTPKTNVDEYWNGEIKWITPAEIEENAHFISDTERHLTELGRKSAGLRIMPRGTVLLSTRAPIGKVAIISEEMCCNQGFKNFICSPEIHNNYIYYFLKNKTEYLNSLGNGATFKEISKKIVEEIKIPLPPLDEQKRIADVLDKASELIKKRKEQIRLMDELAKSLFIEMFGDPVENPMGWTLYLIKDLANPEKNSIKAGPFGSSLKKEFYVTQGYKIYGQEQVISGNIDIGDYYISEDKYLELKSYSIKENDVLISLVGTYGKLLIIPHIFRLGIINPRLMKISFDLKRIMPIYFKFFFESESLKKSLAEKSHGGTMDILNVGIIKMINIPLPPLEVQNEFADRIAVIEQQKTLLQNGLAKMETAYKALMQEYFG